MEPHYIHTMIQKTKSYSKTWPLKTRSFELWNLSRVHFGFYTYYSYYAYYGSILYINDIKSAVNNSDLSLYTDDNYILFVNENVSSIKKHLNADFDSLCEWFLDNRPSIHLVKDKTKCIFFKRETNSISP